MLLGKWASENNKKSDFLAHCFGFCNVSGDNLLEFCRRVFWGFNNYCVQILQLQIHQDYVKLREILELFLFVVNCFFRHQKINASAENLENWAKFQENVSVFYLKKYIFVQKQLS